MRFRSLRALSTLALGLVLVAAACDTKNGNGDGGARSELGGNNEMSTPVPDIAPIPDGLIFFKKAGESADADFATGKEFLVVPYSVSDEAADAIAFDVKLTSAAADPGIGSSASPLITPRRPLRETNPALWARWQRRLAVEAWSRSVMELSAKKKVGPHPALSKQLAGATCKKSGECDPTEVCSAGKCTTTLSVKVGNFAKSVTTIDVDVKKRGEKAAVLVDKGDTVSSANIDAILDKFEKVIHVRDTALFGDPELKAGAGVRSSDRNGDGIVWLVLTSKVQDKKAVGFFDSNDFTEDAKSNQADILYIDSAAKVDDTYAILAHEFQHLLNYSSKVYKAKQNSGQGALEALWLDEGQAHFAEDACGYGGENVTLLNQEVFANFSETAMMTTSKDTLTMRGLAMTYVRYLFEQKGGVTYEAGGGIKDAGGAAFLQALHTSEKQGTAEISALAAPFTDYKNAFDNWVAAVSLDGRGITNHTRFTFRDLIDDPITGNKIGLKIRGTRKDNTGAEVKLEGPIEDAISADKSGTIPNATAKFYKLAGKTGKVGVKVESADTSIRFVLIKTQQQ